MKRWAAFLTVMALVAAALIQSEKRKAEAPVGPRALLYFVADSQRELSRLPVAVIRLSDEDEIRIGNQLAGLVSLPELKESEDREIQAYIRQLGARLAARARRKLPYQFHYAPGEFNAFALPGGHVFMGGGLLAFMDSEDQAAAVLGHEIEHVDLFHCAERLQAEARLRKLRLGQIGALLTLPIQIFRAGYGKDQELEADREGVRLAVRSSYSPVGAIRTFEELNRRYQEQISRATSPREELSDVARQAIEGYFRSHPLPAARIEQMRKMIAAEGWGQLIKERDLPIAYVFLTERAQRAFDRRRYDEAAGMAARSLKVRADQPRALGVLAKAEFARAEFRGAAGACRRLLEIGAPDGSVAMLYADALFASGERRTSAGEFEYWLSRWAPSAVPAYLRVELAGLKLVGGDGSMARDLAARAQGVADIQAATQPPRSGGEMAVRRPPEANLTELTPELLGRLGWWYYRARNYPAAAQLLAAALRERPEDLGLRDQLGWVLVEQRDLEQALLRFAHPMGRAVTYWQARQADKALQNLAEATAGQPEWLNPRWVGALHSPLVVASIEAMRAEQAKRLEAAKRK